MIRTPPLVCVVDDNESIRESLPDLLRQCGFEVRAFASAEDFLCADCTVTASCLIVDIAAYSSESCGIIDA